MKMTLKRGLFLGLLVGVAAAFLYTPKSGKELRQELKDKTDSITEHFLNLIESLVDLSYSLLDFFKSTVKEQSEKISSAVSAGVNAAKEKSEELKKYTAGTAQR